MWNTMRTSRISQLAVTAITVVLFFILGIFVNYQGYIFENIRVDLQLKMHPKLNETLWWNSREVEAGNITELVVPNIVHYIWFGEEGKTMSFVNYLSILSARKVQKPEAILFHCNNLPSGKWWNLLWRQVSLTIIHREAPTHIHNQSLSHSWHQGDIAKLEILMKYGGIYLDYDVIVLNSFDPLRVFDLVAGKEKTEEMNAGILLAKPNAPFLHLWYESFRNNYRPHDWDFNIAKLSYALLQKVPHLVHLETHRLSYPDPRDRDLLFDKVVEWHDLFCIHVIHHVLRREYTPENIKYLRSTFGEITRLTYYGSPDIVK